MCIEAISWAFKQPIKPAALKFVLVAMADCANPRENMKCWPSTKHICAVTGLDRKTVMHSMDELQQLGYITDTGEKCGRTSQVKVFIFNLSNYPENGMLPINPVNLSTEEANLSTELSTQSTKSTENGTLKGARFSPKGARFSLKGSQKRDTEPLLTVTNQLASKKDLQGEKDEFSAEQIRSAGKGDPAYDPEINLTEVLPAAWCAYAQQKKVPYKTIYASWDKLFGMNNGDPLTRKRWNAWIDRERLA